jgi:hypothetical protein
MKPLIFAAALFAAAAPAVAQTSLSISVGQPGFYGRLDIGDFGRPPVYLAEPIIVERSVRFVGEPMYLRVPPGHRKKWSKHCHRYNACGQRVYFVRDDWYENTYAPRYREMAQGGGGHPHAAADHGHERQDKHDKGHGGDKGHGKGHGKDKH